jgi:hypothetical protein
MLMLNKFVSTFGKAIYFIIVAILHFSTQNLSFYLLGLEKMSKDSVICVGNYLRCDWYSI